MVRRRTPRSHERAIPHVRHLAKRHMCMSRATPQHASAGQQHRAHPSAAATGNEPHRYTLADTTTHAWTPHVATFCNGRPVPMSASAGATPRHTCLPRTLADGRGRRPVSPPAPPAPTRGGGCSHPTHDHSDTSAACRCTAWGGGHKKLRGATLVAQAPGLITTATQRHAAGLYIFSAHRSTISRRLPPGCIPPHSHRAAPRSTSTCRTRHTSHHVGAVTARAPRSASAAPPRHRA